MKQLFFSIILVACSVGCATTALYDQQAYALQCQAKVEVQHLMDKASGSYNAVEVERVQKIMDVAYEYDAHRQLNGVTVQQWLLLRHTYSNFTAHWQSQGTCSQTYVNEKKVITGKAFDLLISFESAKLKSSPSVQ